MKISYVMPVYNNASFISGTINSLLNQTHKDFEIIIIDDASNDSIECLKDFYIKENSEIIWHTIKYRKGAAYCRNLANRTATGDIIAVCDSGDFYLPNRGEIINNFFSINPDKDICYTDVQLNDPFNNILGIQKATEWDGKSKPPISHPTVAYRKYMVSSSNNGRSIIKYPECSVETDFYEFFMIKAFRNGYKFGIIPEVTCIKYDLSGSKSYRNVPKAKALKFQKYKEYGIKIERDKV